MPDDPKHPGRRPEKPLAKPVRLFPVTDEKGEPLITDPEGPRRPKLRKLMSIASLIIVFLICVYLLRFPLSALFSPKLYVSLAAENTLRQLNREVVALASGNSVIRRASVLLREPSEQRLKLDAGVFGLLESQREIMLVNDGHRGQLRFEISGAGGDASFYLSDSTIGLRQNDRLYAADPRYVSADLNALLESNKLPVRLPAELDVSYSACKRLVMGGSLGAASPTYDRLCSKYKKLLESLLGKAEYQKPAKEMVLIGGRAVACKAITLRVSAENTREWMLKLADAIQSDGDLEGLFGPLRSEWEISVRGQKFFYNGNVTLKLVCRGNKIISAEYFHVESGTYVKVSTLGEKYMLDNISFASSGAKEMLFQAAGSHIAEGGFRTGLIVKGFGKLDAFDKLQIVWEPSKETDNVTLGRAGKVVKRYTFMENSDGVFISPSGQGSTGVTYSLTKMSERPEWPDNMGSVADIDLGGLEGVFKPK